MEIEAIAGPGRQITPTDVAQFIRLDQCQRYLRLRLCQRNGGAGFMKEYGVVPQSIPPLLTRSGAAFEARVEEAVARHFPMLNCAAESSHGGNRPNDNARVAQLVRDLPPGEVLFLFQPRLAATLGAWNIRGDIDILRLERDAEGKLQVLIADMKSSTSAKVEHRLQVAFYHEMLSSVLAEADVPWENIRLGILYRGPVEGTEGDDGDAARREEQAAAAEQCVGERVGLLEVVADPESYIAAVGELVTGPGSTAEGIAGAAFEALPFVLNYKCDGCMFNEFCMRWSAEEDDLSLLPYLTAEDKSALQRNGIRTVRELAIVKDLPPGSTELTTPPAEKPLVQKLATTWPVGPRLDELIYRARLYRHSKGDPIHSIPFIPSKGYGSLPYSDAQQNPNLVRVYIDAQHDYLQDRIYMLGSLVVACENGIERLERRRNIVHLTDGPPDTPEVEQALFVRWVEDTVRAVVELAAPDEEGQATAPIHLIFFNRFEQRLLLEGLARHFTSILGATPLYDFVTQLAAFDSPIATFLDSEIRELKNYPMVCQSLQIVSAYLRFNWNEGVAYRDLFRTRMFDFWGKFDGPPRDESPWYTNRARFNSQIPLEYAYAAWGDLPAPEPGKADDVASYRVATIDLLRGFHARRLEALEHIAKDFAGNKQTQKRSFDLPDLGAFVSKADTLAEALDEFVTIERHVELGDWKTARLASPERRVLAGETLIVRYCEEDQPPDVVERNRENQRRSLRKAEWVAAHPGETLSRELKKEMAWSQDGLRLRLRLETTGLDCGLDEVLGLTSLREGESIVICRRTTVDSRLPVAEQTEFTPTPKQMLYGSRGTIAGITIERDAAGRAVMGSVEVEMREPRFVQNVRGFIFGAMDQPFHDGVSYTLDADPNDWYGYFCAKVAEGLVAGGGNALYDRLDQPETCHASWPDAAAEGQRRFLEGLDALRYAGAMDPFEPSKREYIGRYGDAPTLLVQGPPGTGKSFSTAYAVFARLQGAMAADLDFRVIVSCKTHAATDVVLDKILDVQRDLRKARATHPDIFAAHFDARLLEVPLFRVQPRGAVPDGVIPLYKKGDEPPDQPRIVDAIVAHRWCVAAAAIGGVYRAIKDRWPSLFGHTFCDCLVLDEASQMNLPEAMMAGLPLKRDGQLIVVGDPRQMPPIIKHDWDGEPRRTFAEFRAYESLFLALLPLAPPMIKFEESFRLHADMAEFLRQEIYVHDGINFHSRQHRRLVPFSHPDPFVASVLSPDNTIVVIVHDEAQSLLRNPFEQALITPVLEALAGAPYNLDAADGLGVVVPHRAQRAALRDAVPCLSMIDPVTGLVTRSAVDTVERFQGDERVAIMVSATESDPQYLLLSGEFLLDPRRLTVALSRAKSKMVLVASQSVFNLFSADEETFANSQLWKNLLRTTCTARLWEGARDGRHVQVWGNTAT